MTLHSADETAAETGTPVRGRLYAAGGIAGAILASTCCIVPLLLVTLGVSGAWIVNLTALEPYKPYFLVAAGISIAAGFRFVYFPSRRDCADGSACARRGPARVTRAALWSGTLLALLAGTVDYWAPLLY